nr:Hypothetical protein [Aeromonas caviae]
MKFGRPRRQLMIPSGLKPMLPQSIPRFLERAVELTSIADPPRQ